MSLLLILHTDIWTWSGQWPRYSTEPSQRVSVHRSASDTPDMCRVIKSETTRNVEKETGLNLWNQTSQISDVETFLDASRQSYLTIIVVVGESVTQKTLRFVKEITSWTFSSCDCGDRSGYFKPQHGRYTCSLYQTERLAPSRSNIKLEVWNQSSRIHRLTAVFLLFKLNIQNLVAENCFVRIWFHEHEQLESFTVTWNKINIK